MKKEGEILATKGQVCVPFMLVNGTIRINGCNRTRPGVFGTECFFGLQSFSDIKAKTTITVLQLNPKLQNVSLENSQNLSLGYFKNSNRKINRYFSFIHERKYLRFLFDMFIYALFQ